jgi:hypothetical protein
MMLSLCAACLRTCAKNSKLSTRENYVCHDGLPYDYEAMMQRDVAHRFGNGAFCIATTGRLGVIQYGA